MLEYNIRILIREFQRWVLMIEGCGNDQFCALLDHVFHGQCSASLVGHILSFDDFDTLDVLCYRNHTIMHSLVVTGIGDGATIKSANDQDRLLFCLGFRLTKSGEQQRCAQHNSCDDIKPFSVHILFLLFLFLNLTRFIDGGAW